MRIACLVPSITELLFALGLGAQLVARTGFCIHPRARVKAVPKVGGTKDVKVDALLRLAPTHVIVNIDENTRAIYETLRAVVPHVIVTHPNEPRDNIGLFRLLGAIFHREQRAAVLIDAFEDAFARTTLAARELPELRVLYLIWRAPWMTVAPDTYIANTLKLVNWSTLPASVENRYPSLSDDEIKALAPDLCLLSSEPFRFRERHRDEVGALIGDRDRYG